MTNKEVALILTQEYSRKVLSNANTKEDYLNHATEIEVFFNEVLEELNKGIQMPSVEPVKRVI